MHRRQHVAVPIGREENGVVSRELLALLGCVPRLNK